MLYSVASAARVLGRDKSQVYRYIREGRLKAIKQSGGLFIYQSQLDEFIKNNRRVNVVYKR